jgi:type I restriction enzyme S subunit
LAQPWAKKRKSTAILPKKDFSSIAFPLPAGWSWAVVETLLPPDETVTYGILKPEWVAEGIPTVRVTEMKTGKINLAALKQCDPVRAAKFQKTTLKPGDLLISKDGTIGKTAFVPPELAGSNITQHLLRYPLSELVNRFFVKLAIDSPFCQKWMAGETKGVALKGVNVSDFRQMPLPIPPLAEQYRIVAKVDELMSLCVQLEAQITVTEQESRRFLESVLADALSHGSNLSTEAQVA